MATPPRSHCRWWLPDSDLVPQDGQILVRDPKGERDYVLGVLGTYEPIALGHLAIRCERRREKDDLGKDRLVIVPLEMWIPAQEIRLEKPPVMPMHLLSGPDRTGDDGA